MASAKSKLQLQPLQKSSSRKSESTLQRIQRTQTNEIVVALCGPIGSPLHNVAETIKKLIEGRFSYAAQVIKLSRIIEAHSDRVEKNVDTLELGLNGSQINGKPLSNEYSRIQKLIDDGNRLRELHGNGILVEIGIADIHAQRTRQKIDDKSERFLPKRSCYIFDSIKNQEELDVLRSVYGKLLICVGVFSPLDFREKELKDRGMEAWEIHKLIDQDSGEEIENGQTVRGTFPQADFFLRADSNSAALTESQIVRLLYMVTRTKIVTPTVHETAMHIAAAASFRSACLSRQVGASITDKHGSLLGVGWNDVPKAGGGLYEEVDHSAVHDYRCMKLQNGMCHNDKQKFLLVDEVVSSLVDGGLVKLSDREKVRNKIQSSKIKDIIEFSRAVHAEMLAIINAAQETGTRMRGGRIYCTTYPCHSCARHIVAAGISEIFYVEPYRKSLAVTLHGDALTEGHENNKVKLIPYYGVAPRKYSDLFEATQSSRKKFGKIDLPIEKDGHYSAHVSLESFPVLEGLILDRVKEAGLMSEE